ncbi:MAG: FG-GAP-like repeat-containing protein [candidate division KSB1 bacterium]|nr:FG-GAP-like repeat-containing protein [candidate division KSB1 bacterium]MDZ7304209.1 FG-GAP-like repeat-containing protein [candidate division KSB1 bacterium]MDZ7313421.1 FG-GAP-like repeat-containing protein [candidate division KSB1 bacterium]
MKKSLHAFIISVSMLFFVLGANPLTAQEVTFSFPDSLGSLGINPNGGGLMGFAWGDYDDDGDLDLLLGGGISDLFRNDVPTGGGFVRVSATTAGQPGTILFDPSGNTYSVQWADFNGDGNLDLLIGDAPNFRIFLYDGSLFTTVDPVATGLIVNSTNAWGVTVGDYDRDGDVDIANAGGTATSDGAGPPHILRNDNGIFTDVGAELVPVPLTLECWHPQWVDIDNDGYLDLWLPTLRRNISPPPRCELLFNESGGELNPSDPSATGLADALSAIVNAWGDYNNDGFMDLWLHPFTGDNAGPNRLYRNNGDRTFTDVAPALGMDSLYSSSATATRGASWGDYNNDGWLDLLVQRRNGNHELWKNNGDGTFTDVGDQARVTIPGGDLRTVAFVDYDSDGWLDIFLCTNGSPQDWLMHNDGGNSNHWIGIRPRATTVSNTSGIGARVTVVTGSHRQYRWIDGGGAGTSTWAHFGLGSATKADSVIVQWPTGGRDFSTNVAADKYYTFREGVGIIVSVKEKPGEKTIPTDYALSQNFPNPFNPMTKIQFDLPKSCSVRLVLINLAGQIIQELANGKFGAGRHEVTFDAGNLAAGVYFYRIEAGDFVAVKKLALVK